MRSTFHFSFNGAPPSTKTSRQDLIKNTSSMVSAPCRRHAGPISASTVHPLSLKRHGRTKPKSQTQCLPRRAVGHAGPLSASTVRPLRPSRHGRNRPKTQLPLTRIRILGMPGRATIHLHALLCFCSNQRTRETLRIIATRVTACNVNDIRVTLRNHCND